MKLLEYSICHGLTCVGSLGGVFARPPLLDTVHTTGSGRTMKDPRLESLIKSHRVFSIYLRYPHQAGSDKLTSPLLAPTVHHPPPGGPTTPGRWLDSLNMASIPPDVQAHLIPGYCLGKWTASTGTIPLPSDSGYPHAPYCSLYYHQRQHQYQAVPDRATSSQQPMKPALIQFRTRQPLGKNTITSYIDSSSNS